ncbi:RrF2 family transcriptional regulator [Saccharopolyspora flava]|uniref:Transcriptional regulator, BadM/Rrf2 family n=1 Tax=Saccharopolyspora flava TaxID=95161 RepID=A0A1I6SRN1_9PSEU|nr:Rrf2 family transcriptional regulator [Saccharopolyspora flava]SFS79621.1 transcriptional regulator, BadM/Rrf2 family [Saccharopolyspora flava]
MRLTKFTDLSLRVVLRLAHSDGSRRITAREVAGSVGAPHTHVAKAVSRLQHLEVVDARRGRGGGLTLTAFGRQASIGWMVRELEGAGDVVGCVDDPPCPLLRGCRLRGALRVAQEAFFVSLDPLTVADLVQDGTTWFGPTLPRSYSDAG